MKHLLSSSDRALAGFGLSGASDSLQPKRALIRCAKGEDRSCTLVCARVFGVFVLRAPKLPSIVPSFNQTSTRQPVPFEFQARDASHASKVFDSLCEFLASRREVFVFMADPPANVGAEQIEDFDFGAPPKVTGIRVATTAGLLDGLHPVAQLAAGSGRQTASSETESFSGMLARCACCDLVVKNKNRFCEVHNRAFESIQRQALKGWKEGDPETPEVSSFKEIFGWKRRGGDEGMASQVLCDFVDRFPDGKNTGSRTTKLRGQICLVQYSHAKSTFLNNYMQEKDPLWDQEFFLRQMDNLRGWKTERALAEWARIKAIGGERDEGGPAHSKERLAIPSNLVGMASVNKDQGFGEQKTMSTGSKLGKMSEEMQATLRGEMAKGFDQNSVGNASVIGLDVTMALPSGALTSAVASEDRDFIAYMVSKVATPAPSDSERTDGGSGGDSMPGHNKTRAKPALVDLPLLRFKSRASDKKAGGQDHQQDDGRREEGGRGFGLCQFVHGAGP